MAKSKKELVVPDELVMSKILLIRGKKVMIDRDLAELYRVPTKQYGAVMLASVLNSDRAIKVNIQIVRIFSMMREMLMTNQEILLKLEKLERQTLQNTSDIKEVFEYLKQMLIPVEQVNRERIGFRRIAGME